MTTPEANLIERIQRVFDGVCLNEDAFSLKETPVIDERRGHEEGLLAREQDIRDDWQSVSQEDIRCNTTVFSYNGESGFRYYLPAYMRHLLLCIGEPTEATTLTVLMHALYTADAGRVKTLSPEQLETVTDFLKYLRSHVNEYDLPEVRQADQVWRRLLEGTGDTSNGK